AVDVRLLDDVEVRIRVIADDPFENVVQTKHRAPRRTGALRSSAFRPFGRARRPGAQFNSRKRLAVPAHDVHLTRRVESGDSIPDSLRSSNDWPGKVRSLQENRRVQASSFAPAVADP